MAITTRAGKGAPLTHIELDTNFTDARDGVSLQIPKAQNSGLKVDSLGTPTFPWVDVLSHLNMAVGATAPALVTYRGTFKQLQFQVNDEIFFQYHIPHDYVVGTDVFIHTHWSHDSALVTGGSVTWGYEVSVAKGWDQGAFTAPVSATILQNASTIQYRHMIAEVVIAIAGGGGSAINRALLEPDSIIIGRTFLSANNITSSGAIPDPFFHQVDLHIQSNSAGTKSRQNPFWT